MNINEVHWNFSNNGTKEPAKPDFETSVTFKPLGFFYAVFTVVLRRMSSIILYMSLYLHWGLFKKDRYVLKVYTNLRGSRVLYYTIISVLGLESPYYRCGTFTFN